MATILSIKDLTKTASLEPRSIDAKCLEFCVAREFVKRRIVVEVADYPMLLESSN